MSAPFPTDEALRWTERFRREHADGLEPVRHPELIIRLDMFRDLVGEWIEDGYGYEALAGFVMEARLG